MTGDFFKTAAAGELKKWLEEKCYQRVVWESHCRNVVSCRMVYRWKVDPDFPEGYKPTARLCAHGFRDQHW